MRKTTTKTNQQLDKQLAQIALGHLFIETLETRNRDTLNFHEVSVWDIKSALIAAYQAGLAAGKNATGDSTDQTVQKQAD